MATSPNFSWPEPDNTDLVKNGALAIRTAVDAIDSSLAELKGGTTGQVLAKASGTDMDFSWVAQDDSNAIQNAIVDAKGDIITATAADTPARLAVGANDLLLTAASGEATGLKYTGGWTSYTPTHLSLTIGNGTVVARYQKIGKIVNVFWRLTWGSTTSTNAYPLISLPITGVYDNYQTGSGTLQDTGTIKYFCSAFLYSTTYFYPVLWNSIGNWVYEGELNATSPATWTTGDIWTMQFSYEVA